MEDLVDDKLFALSWVEAVNSLRFEGLESVLSIYLFPLFFSDNF